MTHDGWSGIFVSRGGAALATGAASALLAGALLVSGDIAAAFLLGAFAVCACVAVLLVGLSSRRVAPDHVAPAIAPVPAPRAPEVSVLAKLHGLVGRIADQHAAFNQAIGFVPASHGCDAGVAQTNLGHLGL